MRRALVLVSVFVCALFAAAPAAAGGPPQIAFRLHADGFIVQVQSQIDGKEMVISLARRSQSATYITRKVQFDGPKASADFARFGSLEMTFDPDSMKGSCAYGEAQGVFTGDLKFTGQRDFASFDVHRARGMFELARCDEFGAAHAMSRPAVGWPRPAPVKHATLAAATPPNSFPAASVVAIGSDDGKFEGAVIATREEVVEGVSVARRAVARLTADQFRWSHKQGTAYLHPPRPFTGEAHLRRNPGGPPSWTGDLSVPILGGDVLLLTGERFRAKLVDAVPSDE
jgi:hypothetical protein